MKIVCVGDCGVDRYRPSGRLLPGGITANFTRQVRKCVGKKDEVHIVSVVGDDDAARVALEAVETPNIKCHVQKVAGSTPVQYIEIHSNGEKKFTKYDRGVLEQFSLNDQQIKIMTEADLIMTPVYWQIYNVFEKVMNIDTKGKIAVDFSDFTTDPNFELLENYADKIDIAFFGLSKNQKPMIDALEHLTTKYDVVIIITLGPDGSMGIKNGKTVSIPAIPVEKIVDTTGAGDAFAAGFLSQYMLKSDIQNALEYGAKIAANTIQHLGSVPTDKS